MKINGTHLTLAKSQSLADFLEAQNFDLATIAVELNGEIVPKPTYREIMLEDTDTLEIVRFVGGG